MYKKINRTEIIIIFLLIIVSSVFLFLNLKSEKGSVASVVYDSEEVVTFKLDDFKESSFYSMEEHGFNVPVTFELKDGQIRFVNSVCPDKLCENYGFISKKNQTAVCLPFKVAVIIK